MKRSRLRATKGGALPRMRLVLPAVLAAFALSAIWASSASAFEWWVGPESAPKPLGAGNKLPINSAGKVKGPFTFKWMHKFEVKCKGVKYNGLFLEGPVFMGAESIAFEECAANKPKKATLVGGKLETAQLHGEITPGAPVGFKFEPAGGTLTSFTIEAPKKRRKHRPTLQCTYHVSVLGNLNGTLGDAEKISTEKTFEFASTGLVFKGSRSCAPAAKMGATSGGTPQEEIERIIREEEECKAGAKSATECKKVTKEAKNLKKLEKEAGEEEKEAEEEGSEEAEEREGTKGEGNKGNTTYSATEGWGVQ
jgi:hypothetical protein